MCHRYDIEKPKHESAEQAIGQPKTDFSFDERAEVEGQSEEDRADAAPEAGGCLFGEPAADQHAQPVPAHVHGEDVAGGGLAAGVVLLEVGVHVGLDHSPEEGQPGHEGQQHHGSHHQPLPQQVPLALH